MKKSSLLKKLMCSLSAIGCMLGQVKASTQYNLEDECKEKNYLPIVVGAALGVHFGETAGIQIYSRVKNSSSSIVDMNEFIQLYEIWKENNKDFAKLNKLGLELTYKERAVTQAFLEIYDKDLNTAILANEQNKKKLDDLLERAKEKDPINYNKSDIFRDHYAVRLLKQMLPKTCARIGVENFSSLKDKIKDFLNSQANKTTVVANGLTAFITVPSVILACVSSSNGNK